MSLMMVYKFLHGCAPSYLGLFNYVADLPSRRGLRSSCSVHPPVHCWRSSIFGCWPPGVELPVTEGYVGAMSDSLLHSTPFRNDSSAHIRLNLTFLRLHTVHNGPIAVLQMLRSLKKFMIDRVDATGASTCRYRPSQSVQCVRVDSKSALLLKVLHLFRWQHHWVLSFLSLLLFKTEQVSESKL